MERGVTKPAESRAVFNFLRNLHGKAYFYLLAFMFSLQTASKHNVHHYCLWGTHTHRENTGMWKNTEFFSLPWVLPTSHQSARQQLEHVSEDQLQRGMSSWISGEFGVWLRVFPAEFGRMEREGKRLLERYSCTCPASPSTPSRHQSFHERSPCSGHFHRGDQGFPPLWIRNFLCCWDFHMAGVSLCSAQ